MNLILDSAGIGLGALAAGAIVQSVPPEAQGWTVLGLLAIVVVGIGGKLVLNVEKSGDKVSEAIGKSNDRVIEAINKQTVATGDNAKALAVLSQKIDVLRDAIEDGSKAPKRHT